MALTSDQITAQNFKDFYDTILPYLNGGQSAENVTYGQGSVKDALDEERNHSLGTTVILTYDTEYVTTSDGYFRVTCNDSGNYYSTGYVDNRTMITAKSSSSDAVSGCAAVFVRKGTSIKFKGTNATVAGGTFFPLV